MKVHAQSASRQILVLTALAVAGVGCGADPGTQLNTSRQFGGEAVQVSDQAATPADMGVGDIYTEMVDGANSVTIDMDGVDYASNFILVLSNLSSDGGEASVTTSYDEAVDLSPAISVDDQESEGSEGDTVFHEQLRELEANVAEEWDPSVVANVGKAAMVSSELKIGDQERFHVLASVSGSSYNSVTASLRCIGENVTFYVDLTNPTSISDSDVSELCHHFDDQIPIERSLFGDESDVNGDGKVTVLITPSVNRLGTLAGGMITGFFYAADLQSPGGPNATSNGRELIYMVAPDPTAQYGFGLPTSFAIKQLIPAVLVHEFQHAINFNQHVLLRGGSVEEPWLNEGLSHLAEDLLGVGNENPSRYQLYLKKPSQYAIVTSSSPGLASRGGIYLFLRYLYEQAADGSAFVRALLNTDAVGAENIEEAFAGSLSDFDQFGEFYLRFGLSLVMSGYGVSADARYLYQPPVTHPDTGHLMGAILSGPANDGRGTVISPLELLNYYGVHSASLSPSQSKYYLVSTPPSQIVVRSTAATSTVAASLIRVE